MIKVISQIRKKITKVLPAEEIADMLEEDIDYIRTLSDLISAYPKKTDEEIYKLYQESYTTKRDKKV